MITFKCGVNYLVLDLVSEKFSHIRHLLLDELLKESLETWQHLVLHVVVPRLNPDAIVGSCSHEVLREVIHDNRAFQLASKVV